MIVVQPSEKRQVGPVNYDNMFKIWNEWDDDNYAPRTVMINMMSSA